MTRVTHPSTSGRALVLLLAAACLIGYVAAESRGWAFGGRKSPERIGPEQLRSASPGSWRYVYWMHGSRGK